MAVRRRGKTWVIDYYVNGKKYIRAIGRNKREAIAAESKIRTLVREGRYSDGRPHAANVTFGELIEKYLLHFNGKRSFATESIHLAVIRDFFGPRKIIREIGREDVESFQLARKNTPTRNGRGRSSATVNRELAVLHRFFNKAVSWGLVASNPATGIKSLPESRGRVRFLTVEEAGRLLDASPAHLRPIVLCALETGMRRGEILNMRWSDLDLERRVLFVGETKTGIPRYVPISTCLKEMLERLPRRPGCDHVFIGGHGKGKVWKPFHDVRTSFGNACRKAGIVEFRFHDLRHTAASHMVMAGVPIKVVGEILGHSTVSMTERYSHLLPEHKLRAVEMLPDWKGHSHGGWPEPHPA